MRFVDFAIHRVWDPDLSVERNRAANRALFAFYEPLRLWVRDHKITAPFRKLCVTLDSAPGKGTTVTMSFGRTGEPGGDP